MECNKTFISIKQLEEQDISADKICSILFQLYDELAINEQAIKVDDLKSFRSHMNTLLDRILKLYKANEDDLSKLALFKRIEDKEKNVEDYLNKINDLEEEIKSLDKLNIELKEKTSHYQDVLNKNKKLEEENKMLKERLLELDKIDLGALENLNNKILQNINKKEEEYNKITNDKEELDEKLKELDNKYMKANQILEDLNNKYILGKTQINRIEEKNKELENLMKENEDLLSKRDSLKKLTDKTNELTDINNTIKQEIKTMNDILGKEETDDNDCQLKKLESLHVDVSDLLEDYLVNNYIYEIEDEINLNDMGLLDYLEFMNKYILNTRSNMESYYKTTKRIYKIISRENKTARKNDDE